ncbi:MAG: hypothetical protein F4X58_12770 [Chloroflexi bacterium]|nr:hypothetical protein [Chloroflexota bacterium]MYC02783.1 hypothetical protein [Chloroflexota bacterium]
MKLWMVAALVVLALAAGAVDLTPAVAQQHPCTPGSTSPKLTWHDRLQSWVVQEFGCEDGVWKSFGAPIHNFNTQDKSGGWYPLWSESGGPAVYVSTKRKPLPAFTDGYPEQQRAAILTAQRIITQTPSASSASAGLADAGYRPSDVYRIGGNWVYLPDGYDYPDATMSAIWRSVPECR